MANSFEMIAKTFQGLEEVLAKELEELGASQIEIIRRGVRFFGDKEMLYKANFCCRTALRILKPIYQFDASDTEEVYQKIKAFDWSQFLDTKKTFAIDSVVYSDTFKHSKFLAYKIKDAIVDYFMEREGERPSVRVTNPDLQLNIHVAQEHCTLSLDSSGESLHLRGYKEEQTEAPLNEVMAAGLLKLAGWSGQSDFMDPMCGSGTIAIEAVMMALNIAPGVYRKGFAFEKWADFDEELLQNLYNDDSNEREFRFKAYASDISSQALRIAERNVKSAGLSKYITLSHKPFQSVERPQEDTFILFNPPYGERLRMNSLATLYEEMGSKLKKDFTDMSVWMITVSNEATDKIGLRPSEKYHLLNGSLECEFRKYEMFKGRRNDYLKERFDKQKEQNKEEENNSWNGVYLRSKRDYWERESLQEGELSEYHRRRHEEFAKRNNRGERGEKKEQCDKFTKRGVVSENYRSEKRFDNRNKRSFGKREGRGGFGKKDNI